MSNGRKFANIIVGTEVKVSVVDSDLAMGTIHGDLA